MINWNGAIMLHIEYIDICILVIPGTSTWGVTWLPGSLSYFRYLFAKAD